jgi:hypothetical protein
MEERRWIKKMGAEVKDNLLRNADRRGQVRHRLDIDLRQNDISIGLQLPIILLAKKPPKH